MIFDCLILHINAAFVFQSQTEGRKKGKDAKVLGKKKRNGVGGTGSAGGAVGGGGGGGGSSDEESRSASTSAAIVQQKSNKKSKVNQEKESGGSRKSQKVCITIIYPFIHSVLLLVVRVESSPRLSRLLFVQHKGCADFLWVLSRRRELMCILVYVDIDVHVSIIFGTRYNTRLNIVHRMCIYFHPGMHPVPLSAFVYSYWTRHEMNNSTKTVSSYAIHARVPQKTTVEVEEVSADTTGHGTPHPSDVLDMPVDPNEPTYCLCHQVSYGEMIGCDNPDVSTHCMRRVACPQPLC